jgi:hypothetical protein
MTPRELNDARHSFGLGRKDFGKLIGYSGDPRHIWVSVKRMETGERPIPENIQRLVQLLVWFKADHGHLPDFEAGTRGPLRIPEAWEMNDG